MPTANLPRNPAGEYPLDFGSVTLRQRAQHQFSFANDVQDNMFSNLDELSLPPYALVGDVAERFDLEHNTSSRLTRQPQASLLPGLSFAPAREGSYSAAYRIVTDANADLGAEGDVFSFRPTGQA